MTGLRRLGADPDAVELLVGHSLELRGVYTDPEAYGLRDVVALIPSLDRAGSVSALDVARKG